MDLFWRGLTRAKWTLTGQGFDLDNVVKRDDAEAFKKLYLWYYSTRELINTICYYKAKNCWKALIEIYGKTYACGSRITIVVAGPRVSWLEVRYGSLYYAMVHKFPEALDDILAHLKTPNGELEKLWPYRKDYKGAMMRENDALMRPFIEIFSTPEEIEEAKKFREEQEKALVADNSMG
jgi:hypothetical protein